MHEQSKGFRLGVVHAEAHIRNQLFFDFLAKLGLWL